MRDWEPISGEELRDEINRGCGQMTEPQRRLWGAIQILPTKWQLPPWGNEGNGFWVVAILGRTVVWFNDIEGGFNRSPYSEIGTISVYRCNQDELQWQVQALLDEINTGISSGGHCGPPQQIE
jgi:hypothetical protein